MKNLMMGRGVSYPVPALLQSPHSRAAAPTLAPPTMARIEREARAMNLTPDQLVDRALLALADEVDAVRGARRAAGEALPTTDGPR